MVQVHVDGVDRLIEQLGEMARRVDAATDRGVDVGLDIIATEARHQLNRQSHAPFTSTPSVAPDPPARISGALGDSIVPTRDASSDGVHSGRVGPTKIYSRVQELGAVITRKYAPMLRWFVDGSWHSALSVYIPPRPYMAPALEEAKPRLARALRNLWDSAVHRP